LADFFAGVMLLVAVYSLGRLVASRLWSRPTHADVDATHVLMGTAMAGMLVAAINPVPRGVWEVVFAVVALWFVWRCYDFAARHGVTGHDDDHVHHFSHQLTHLVMALAMLYMYLAATPIADSTGGGMAMGGATGTTADFVGLPLLFLFALLASAIWELDGAERFVRRPADVAEAVLVPDLAESNASPLPAAGETAAPAAIGVLSPIVAQDRRWLAPGLKAACHIAMCITMGYMLIVML
jgi:hypothetical protein